MRQIIKYGESFHFVGLIDNLEDYNAASRIAAKCPTYSVDDDDEDYCEGERTCFNCRYRRWLAGGFQCMKGCLTPEQYPAQAGQHNLINGARESLITGEE